MRLLRRGLLVAETTSWHWYVVLVLLLGGSATRGALGALWGCATVVAVLVLDGSRRHRRGLAAYVGVSRVLLLGSQIGPAWTALHLAPLASGSALLAAAWLALRRPGGLSPVRAATLLVGVVGTVNVAWYLGAGLDGECSAALTSPALRPLVSFRPVGPLAEADPLWEPDCRTGRTASVDAETGAVLLACGTDPQRPRLAALTRVDPDAPGARETVYDRSAYEAVSIPSHERVWLSVFGRDQPVVRGFDRGALGPVAEVATPVPWMLEYDAGADRLLVGVGGANYDCLYALDPTTGAVVGRVSRPLLDVTGTQCSPADIALLPALDRIVVTNFAGSLSLSVFRYSTLELVGARHRAIPTRDAVVSEAGDRVWVAVPFLGRLEELDAQSLEGFAPPGPSPWRALPGVGMLDPPGHKAFPEARRIPTEFGAAYLTRLGRDALVLGNYMLGTLRRLDLASGRLGPALPVGRLVRDVTYDAERRRLYTVSACGLFEVDPAALEEDVGGD